MVHYPGFEQACDDAPKSARCLVIMNRARNPAGPAFYALATVGLPRMLQLVEGDVRNLEAELGIADVMQVQVGTEAAIIPNLGYIEECLSALD